MLSVNARNLECLSTLDVSHTTISVVLLRVSTVLLKIDVDVDVAETAVGSSSEGLEERDG